MNKLLLESLNDEQLVDILKESIDIMLNRNIHKHKGRRDLSEEELSDVSNQLVKASGALANLQPMLSTIALLFAVDKACNALAHSLIAYMEENGNDKMSLFNDTMSEIIMLLFMMATNLVKKFGNEEIMIELSKRGIGTVTTTVD